MHLPQYFLTDLPPEAGLSPGMITEACESLKKNRDRYLLHRSTDQMVDLLSETAESWRHADYPLRQLALKEGPAATGFSRATLERGLDEFFSQITFENLTSLLHQELGHAQRADGFRLSGVEQRLNRHSLARGPRLLAHIAGGMLPNPTFLHMILGLLLRSAQFVKCPSGGAFLPNLFAHSLYEMDSKIGSCLELAVWPGGNTFLEEALFAESDCLTTTGSDETLHNIRVRLPRTTRLVEHGHRLSFGYVHRGMLSGFKAKKMAVLAAADVAAWDQLGCLSPHVIYVEQGGAVSAGDFAELLAQELEKIEVTHPRGTVTAQMAATITYRRSFYEVRAASSLETRLWHSQDSTAWTVVYETEARFQVSCLNRFIYVKGVDSLTQALQGAEPVWGKVSTVGLAALEEEAPSYAEELARWGVTRICPLGQMQQPSLLWHHDGRSSLADLVSWSDWER